MNLAVESDTVPNLDKKQTNKNKQAKTKDKHTKQTKSKHLAVESDTAPQLSLVIFSGGAEVWVRHLSSCMFPI